MKKLIAVAIAAIGLAFGSHAITGTPRARCSYCYTGTCYNSAICGRGCVCLKRGLDIDGECYSVD